MFTWPLQYYLTPSISLDPGILFDLINITCPLQYYWTRHLMIDYTMSKLLQCYWVPLLTKSSNVAGPFQYCWVPHDVARSLRCLDPFNILTPLMFGPLQFGTSFYRIYVTNEEEDKQVYHIEYRSLMKNETRLGCSGTPDMEILSTLLTKDLSP